LRNWGLFNAGGMGVVGPGACCCESGGACLCDVYGLFTYYPHIFDGGPGGRMYASPGLLDTQDEPYQAHGCITKSYGDDPFGHELHFRWVGEPGFQYVRTLVFSHHGEELVDIVYPMFGSKGTTVANRATAPLYALAESIPQPTLTVDIEVEGNVVPPAVAGHYRFPQGEDYEGGKKYYTYEMDYPDPYFDKHSELIAVTVVPHEGFELKSWTGNCAYYDANGNYLGMLPESIPEDPEDWITDDTIYVKCLKAVGTHTASAMTDMAVLAGASAEGAIPPESFLVINAAIQAKVGRGVLVIEGGGALQRSTVKLGSLNYDTKTLTRPKTKERALKEIYDQTRLVFVFNGHGLEDIPGTPQTEHGDEILIHQVGEDDDFPCDQDDEAEPPTEDIWLRWSEVTSKLHDQPAHYRFVYLGCCYCGSQYEYWRQAFKAKAVFGFMGPVLKITASRFDEVFWEKMLDVYQHDYEPKSVFLETRRIVESEDLFFGKIADAQGRILLWDLPIYDEKEAGFALPH
ncbi:MAG: hypothetical protein U9Q79_06610, partial [Candidatus Hydrogenedentes bacterium]|nr:hypothetical protein [Candidatus Hydrogenedentota bacterium]